MRYARELAAIHLRVEAMVKRVPGWREKINVVWLLPGDCRFAPLAPELNGLAKRNFKLSFEAPPKNQSRELVNGFERIIHQLRGIRIGIALGGGAARGMAHLGVLKVLEQNGIIIDMIVGTSVGAMTGILYASGMEPDYNVDSFVKDLTPSWLFRHLPNGGYWYLLYQYRRGKFDTLLAPVSQEQPIGTTDNSRSIGDGGPGQRSSRRSERRRFCARDFGEYQFARSLETH